MLDLPGHSYAASAGAAAPPGKPRRGGAHIWVHACIPVCNDEVGINAIDPLCCHPCARMVGVVGKVQPNSKNHWIEPRSRQWRNAADSELTPSSRDVCMHVCTCVFMLTTCSTQRCPEHVCMYVCMYACMHVCMHAGIRLNHRRACLSRGWGASFHERRGAAFIQLSPARCACRPPRQAATGGGESGERWELL